MKKEVAELSGPGVMNLCFKTHLSIPLSIIVENKVIKRCTCCYHNQVMFTGPVSLCRIWK